MKTCPWQHTDGKEAGASQAQFSPSEVLSGTGSVSSPVPPAPGGAKETRSAPSAAGPLVTESREKTWQRSQWGHLGTSQELTPTLGLGGGADQEVSSL